MKKICCICGVCDNSNWSLWLGCIVFKKALKQALSAYVLTRPSQCLHHMTTINVCEIDTNFHDNISIVISISGMIKLYQCNSAQFKIFYCFLFTWPISSHTLYHQVHNSPKYRPVVTVTQICKGAEKLFRFIHHLYTDDKVNNSLQWNQA